MRRLVALASFALVFASAPARAEVAADASLLDVNVPDVTVPDAGVDAAIDATAADAASDATTTSDAAADAGADSGAKDTGTSDACNPNIEPCTTRADAGTTGSETGDNEGAGGGGCSCDSAPFDAGMASPLLLVVLASIARSRKKRAQDRC